MTKRWIALVVILIVCNFCCVEARSPLRVHFIDVGHGDAILVERDGEGIALIDAGRPEAGMLVLDYLRSLDIESIEHLFVTHDHQDHVGGAPLILDSIHVARVYHTGMVHDWEEARIFATYLEKGLWLEEIVDAGDIPVEEDDLNIQVLSPLAEETAGKTVDPNPNSMVLLMTHGEIKFLLPADIYAIREQWLIQRYGSFLSSQVMKAPHHGSSLGSSAGFLEVVQPQVVILTVGSNEWGYPASETMGQLRAYCSNVLRTDEMGTIILESDGNALKITTAEGVEP